MPKMRLVVSVMVMVGVIMVGEAVYLFTRPEKLTMAQGLVMVGIATVALFVLMGMMVVVWKSLSKTNKPQNSKPENQDTK